MKYKDIIKDINNRIYQPIYFLWGAEPFFIDSITDLLMDSVLSDSEKDFNQTVLYGKDTDIYQVIELARRFPMMANQQLVVIKEAQELKNLKVLENYLENPVKSTILVLNYKYKKIDKRLKLYKLIPKHGLLFESKPVYDKQLGAWIDNYLADRGCRIDARALMMLLENLGNNLNKIVNELDKLIIGIDKENPLIDCDMVEENIGISKEYNNFELMRAIGLRDKKKAYRIISFYGQNPKNHPGVLSVGIMFRYFKSLAVLHNTSDRSRNNLAAVLGIPTFAVNEYIQAARQYDLSQILSVISLLREYDLKLKGVDSGLAGEGELMRELCFKIFNT